MKKTFFISLLLVGLLLSSPVTGYQTLTGTMVAQAQEATESRGEVATEGVPSSEDTTETTLEPVPIPDPPEEETELPWFLRLLWGPVISTALISVLRFALGALKSKVPPLVWPVLNALLVALIAAVQSTADPANLIKNIAEQVMIALGLVKGLDVGTGKVARLKPAEKKAFEDAKASGTMEKYLKKYA